MEPRIILGHAFKCKKSVVCKGDKNPSFIKGKVYYCTRDTYYPDESWGEETRKLTVGTIVNEQGVQHSWPYDPQNHPWCHDSWTDYFTDLGISSNC